MRKLLIGGAPPGQALDNFLLALPAVRDDCPAVLTGVRIGAGQKPGPATSGDHPGGQAMIRSVIRIPPARRGRLPRRFDAWLFESATGYDLVLTHDPSAWAGPIDGGRDKTFPGNRIRTRLRMPARAGTLEAHSLAARLEQLNTRAIE